MITHINPNSKAVDELLNYIIDRSGKLSKQIRRIHDHAVHFSTEDLDEDIRQDLYFVAHLSEIICEIENNPG